VELIGDIFIMLMLRPMLNALMILYALLAENMAAAIIALTVLVKVIFFPLTVRQFRSTARMQGLQPEIEKLRTRYKDEPQELNRRMWRLYREAGVNPIGCLGPMIIQFPIMIGLYYAIIKGLGNLPGAFVYLSQRLYDWNPVGAEILPLDTTFLWLDLAVPSNTGGPLDAVLPLLVGVSTWAQQKMMSPPSATGQQRQQQQIMLFMFPVMLGFFAFTFPSGLALYWFVSNGITVGMQGFTTGGFGNLRIGRRAHSATPATAVIESRTEDGAGPAGDDGEDGSRSSRGRAPGARNRPRRRRRRRT
jgi:YidC/Oxa1 family membrane protein insertase